MNCKPVALGILLAVYATLWAAASAVADEAADHDALRKLVSEYEAAIQKGDPSVLRPYLAPGFSGVMVTGEEVKDYESLDAYWKKIQQLLGDGGKYTVKINIPAPATIAGDFAFAHGTTEDTAITSDGKQYKFGGFWTAVCTRSGDGWKIVRIHGSMDAISNTFVMTAIRSVATKTAIVAGLVGFGIGAIVMWISTHRRRGSMVAA